MESQTTPSTSGRQRAWANTAEDCEVLGMSRETLRQLRLLGCWLPVSITDAGAAPWGEVHCSGTSGDCQET